MFDALASVTYGDVSGLTQFTLEQQLRPTEKHEKMVCAYDDYRIFETARTPDGCTFQKS